MKDDPGQIGQWTASRRFQVDSDAVDAYAMAVGFSESHVSRSEAPPLFGVVPAREPMLEAQGRVVSESVRRTSVLGEHDIILGRLIEPGMTLLARAAVVGVRVVSAGTQVVAKTETTLENGEAIDEQWWTALLRGVDLGWSAGDPPPSKPPPDRSARADFEVLDWIAPDQSFRYAEASGDKDAYVLDEGAARAAGFPGIILHGLCTMAFAGRAVVGCAERHPNSLRRLGVRFTRPLLLGQQITTSIWKLPARNESDLYTFTVTEASGVPVIQRGIAEFEIGLAS